VITIVPKLFFNTTTMDFETAWQFVLRQTTIEPIEDQSETFMLRLKQGNPPIPGQVTSLLLALKVLFEGLKNEPALDRTLIQALFALACESRQLFDKGKQAGVTWPPLLDEDLGRITKAAQSIVTGVWQV
jgi:hypothetical protein